MMLRLDVTFDPPNSITTASPNHDVSGIIGLSGDVMGSVILSFPTESAEKIIGKFIGFEVKAGSEDFSDAIGELANMVAGSAKAKISGKNISISCPSVVVGKNHCVQQPSDSTSIIIPCKTELGNFNVEISFRNGNEEANTTVPGAATAGN